MPVPMERPAIPALLNQHRGIRRHALEQVDDVGIAHPNAAVRERHPHRLRSRACRGGRYSGAWSRKDPDGYDPARCPTTTGCGSKSSPALGCCLVQRRRPHLSRRAAPPETPLHTAPLAPILARTMCLPRGVCPLPLLLPCPLHGRRHQVVRHGSLIRPAVVRV
jgi:hypothetical protein